LLLESKLNQYFVRETHQILRGCRNITVKKQKQLDHF